jgi:hypothetical protein
MIGEQNISVLMTARQIIDALTRIALVDAIVCTIATAFLIAVIVVFITDVVSSTKFLVIGILACIVMIMAPPAITAKKYFTYIDMDVETLRYDNVTKIAIDGDYVRYVTEDGEMHRDTKAYVFLIRGEKNQVYDWKRKGTSGSWTKIYYADIDTV